MERLYAVALGTIIGTSRGTLRILPKMLVYVTFPTEPVHSPAQSLNGSTIGCVLEHSGRAAGVAENVFRVGMRRWQSSHVELCANVSIVWSSCWGEMLMFTL